jgi:hypothetical protein
VLVVPLTRKSTFPSGSSLTGEQQAEFHGHQFIKTGNTWVLSNEAARLSPDQAWLGLQSTSGGDRQRGPTKVFLDVFSTDTGKNILTLEGVYSNGIGTSVYSIDPDGYLTKTAWLGERYFIVPLGSHKESCLVCEFAARSKQEKTANASLLQDE